MSEPHHKQSSQPQIWQCRGDKSHLALIRAYVQLIHTVNVSTSDARLYRHSIFIATGSLWLLDQDACYNILLRCTVIHFSTRDSTSDWLCHYQPICTAISYAGAGQRCLWTKQVKILQLHTRFPLLPSITSSVYFLALGQIRCLVKVT